MPVDLTSLVETRVVWAMHHRALPHGDSWRRPVPACTLWLMLNGAAEVTLDGKTWCVPRGAALLANWRTERNIVLLEGAEWLTVGLQAHLLGRDLLPLIGLPVLWTPDAQASATLEWSLRELARLHPCTGALALVCDGLSRVLAGLVLSAHDLENLTPGGQGSAPSWLGRVQRLAKDNPGVSVAQLAREAGFSPAQFRRVFHDWAKMSPHEFLQRERLELASKLLESTNLSVEEIARRCGFSNASTFARTFRAFANFSPAAYRQAVRTMAQEQA